MSKGKTPKSQPFDGKSKRFLNINQETLLSENFKHLSNSAKLLYFYMRMEQFGVNEKEHPEKDNKKFYFTQKQYKEKYNIFSSPNAFINARDELINAGFIDCIADNSYTRQMNIYKYSDRWKYLDNSNNERKIDKRIITASIRHKI
ncbi:MAG: hypothetical protein LIO62_04850 [Clostridiales bacterium]|nr:hypothetical protein [Clostridiales bacterium]